MSIVASPGNSVRTGSSPRPGWSEQLRTAIRDAGELCRRLELPPPVVEVATRAAADFPVFAPLSFVGRMRRRDPHDPLLRQVLPLDDELRPSTASVDAVGDGQASIVPGLLQKYSGRALLITTGACAVHCRYCFRRHFPYSQAPRSLEQLQPALEALAARAEIREVLLSGGDPLTLVDDLLSALAQRLEAIPHLRRLRIHTRLPIVIPDRVTDSLLNWITRTRLTPWMVVHTNHPAEIDDDVAAALGRIVEAGIPVLNQAVLLRGVNDDVDTLVALNERLCDLRVAPYYLHQLDPVPGALHFAVPIEEGRQIVEGLWRRLPGYAVPRYVCEVAGAPGKQFLA